jgi:8-oxo-dGTP diphosphatase
MAMQPDPRSQWEGSAVFLIDGEGRVLLQQRDDHWPPEGYGRWAIPGGRREGAETALENALREFEEETGARLSRIRFWQTLTPSDVPGLAASRMDIFFADDRVSRAEMVVNEGLDFQYWHPDDIPGLRINPPTREVIERFLASDSYRGTVAVMAPYKVGVGILEIDRWGRLLLQLRDADLPPERYPGMWSIPGGLLEPGEAPDAAAFREFEEETGHLLESLKLFHVYRKDGEIPTSLTDVYHVYYVDADIDEAHIQVNEGQAFRYFRPDEMAGLEMPPVARRVIGDFLESPAYRAMFH